MFGTEIPIGVNFNKFQDIEVEVVGDEIDELFQLKRFESAGWKASLVRNIKRSGYTKSTPIKLYKTDSMTQLPKIEAIQHSTKKPAKL